MNAQARHSMSPLLPPSVAALTQCATSYRPTCSAAGDATSGGRVVFACRATLLCAGVSAGVSAGRASAPQCWAL
jgi:hypothetical protein